MFMTNQATTSMIILMNKDVKVASAVHFLGNRNGHDYGDKRLPSKGDSMQRFSTQRDH